MGDYVFRGDIVTRGSGQTMTSPAGQRYSRDWGQPQ